MKVSYFLPLACTRSLDTRVRSFVLGHHLGFGNCKGLGQGNICHGSRREVEKWARGEGKGKEKPSPYTQPVLVKHLITIQDGGIKNLVYLTLSLQCSRLVGAIELVLQSRDHHRYLTHCSKITPRPGCSKPD